MQRYLNEPSREATIKYETIAKDAGMSLATMALAWCRTRWYVASTIIGATTMEQLRENIDAFDPEKAKLSEETLRRLSTPVPERERHPQMIPRTARATADVDA